MSQRPVILWFRQDLRLTDHPALVAATRSARPVIPVYVLDDETPGRWRMGGASRWWLGTSLPRLAADLEKAGSRLVVRRGRALDVLPELVGETGASAVYLSRRYEPWAAREEKQIQRALRAEGVLLHRYAGGLLFEPESVKNRVGEPFRVFTPFARAVEALPEPRDPLPRPASLLAPARWPVGLDSLQLGLLPVKPDWAGGLRAAWVPGEAGAISSLTAFLERRIATYSEARDRLDVDGTSRLSPHLHFGEVSPAACWHAASARRGDDGFAEGVAKFRRELLWREFSYHLLHHFPDLPEMPFRPEFQSFPWKAIGLDLGAWQRGSTGFPIVDAGLRQLWRTGYMHNRVRMIAASFLVKDLLLPWQDGAAWFWDTLVDADLANNSASWQWVAGCGADAAPYFRIFNPVKQGRKFDPDGAYVCAYVPELARLPTQYIHAPFEAPAAVLAEAGIELGTTYPAPIVDHAEARRRALAALAAMRTIRD